MDTFEFIRYLVEQEHVNIENLLDSLEDKDLSIPVVKNKETIGDRFKHMCVSEYEIAGYLYKSSSDINPDDIITNISVDNLKKAFEISMKRHMLTLKNLSVEDLTNLWTSPRTGNVFSYRWLIYHQLEHLATHRGQIAMAIRMYKEKTT